MWTEDDSCDLAISFQEKAGCDDMWGNICEVKCVYVTVCVEGRGWRGS